MVVALPKAKERFATIIEGINPEPWTMLQFIIWLDLKLAEYKINGYMVLDQSIGSIPEWLANLNVDQHDDDSTFQFEDTHIEAPQFIQDESSSVEEILPVEMPGLTTAQYNDDDNHDYEDRDHSAVQNKLRDAGNTFKRTATQMLTDTKKRKFGARVQLASETRTNNSPRPSMHIMTAESRLVAPANRSLDSSPVRPQEHKQLHVDLNVHKRTSSTITTANPVNATERGSININTNPPLFVHHRPVGRTSTVTQASTTESKDEQAEPFPAQLFVNNVGLENRRAFPSSPGVENSGYGDTEHQGDSSYGNVPQLDNTTYDESGDISTDSPNDFHIKTEPEDTRPEESDTDTDGDDPIETPVSDLSMQAWQSINPKWQGSKSSVIMKSLLNKHNIKIANMANYQRKRCYQYTPEMRETIARYAIEYGTANASRWFSSELGHPIRGSTVHTMKLSFLKKYGSYSTEGVEEKHS